MGRKVTIDSATMMNKGLEVIEAHWLFNVPVDDIAVHIHPESIVHSMVEYVDGALIAQLGIPDMKTPIAYALTYPERLTLNLPALDLCRLSQLNFAVPNSQCFPCLGLAYDAIRRGGTTPAVLNAVNELAVEAFLQEKIAFLDIPRIISKVVAMHSNTKASSLESILAADTWARQAAQNVILESQGVSYA
jgi:1-deoxy-D-xylulose-5-phosphate reductoisomerase